MDGQRYRMKFGRHEGRTLQDVPPSYLSWLIEKEVYANKEDLKAALIQGKYLSSAAGPESSPSTPIKKRQVSESEEAVPRKITISKLAKNNGTMLNYDGSAYILDFGTYAGNKLSDVPLDYISWLIREGVHKERADLAVALREAGLLADHCSTDITDPAWRVPSTYETKDSRFFDPWTQHPLWISDADVSRYFRLGEPLLSRAGVRLVSDAEKRSMEFPELLTNSKSPKRWLYQVYACASQIGAASGDSSRCDTADMELNHFLSKNQRREREIWDGMGLGN